MYKFLFTLSAIFIYAIQINCEAQWQLTGNNNATNTSILGTTNAINLRLTTRNVTRMTIDSNGRIGIGTTTPLNILTVKGAGSTPANLWANAGAPLFVGFGENTVGNADFILGMGAPAYNARPVFIGRKSRGTLANPNAVADNDFLMSFLSSGFDGSAFQNPAAIDFFVDGTPTAGNVPARISFVTGSNSTTRAERLKIGNTGDFSFNGSQLTLSKSTGDVAIGSGNLLVAKNSFLQGKVGVNGDTLFSTALTVNANNLLSGITVNNLTDGLALYANKTGRNQGLYIVKESKTSVAACIVGESTGTSPGIEGYSKSNTAMYGQSDSGYAMHALSFNNIGIYSETQNPISYAGYFNGDVYSTGTYTSSDARLKENIQDVDNALKTLSMLQPKTYTFKSDGSYSALHLPSGFHYGLLAQDLEKSFPSLVKETEVFIKDINKNIREDKEVVAGKKINYKAVNYIEFIPLMIKGLQELTLENDHLKKANEQLTRNADEFKLQTNNTINDLQQQINSLKELITGKNTYSSNFGNQQKGYESTLQSTTELGQNIPNPPINKTTKISYNLPGRSSNGEIIITDINGIKVRQFLITQGRGVLTVNTTELASGTYSYTLFANGKRVATKQLIITSN